MKTENVISNVAAMLLMMINVAFSTALAELGSGQVRLGTMVHFS